MAGIVIGGGPPAAPPQSAAFGYTKATFYSPFRNITEIDTTNSKAAGFNWYVNNSWSVTLGSSATQAFWNNTAPTAANLLSITAGGLLVSSDISGIASSIQSAVYVGGGPGAGAVVRGTTFAGGGYFETAMAYDPANSPAGGSGPGDWPASWMVPTIYLTGQLASGSPFVEFDHYEAGQNTPGTIAPTFALGDTTDTTTTGAVNFNTNANQLNNAVFNGAVYTNRNLYGSLWVPAAQNGGTGLIRRYFNNQRITAADITYTATTGCTPGASPSNPNGIYAEMDAHAFIWLHGTGLNFPCTFGSTTAWQLP